MPAPPLAAPGDSANRLAGSARIQAEAAPGAPAAAESSQPAVSQPAAKTGRNSCLGALVLAVVIVAGAVAGLAAFQFVPALIRRPTPPPPAPTATIYLTPSETPTPIVFPTLPPVWTPTFTPSATSSPTAPATATPVPPTATSTAVPTPTPGAAIAAGNVVSLTQLAQWTSPDPGNEYTCFAISPDGLVVAVGTSAGTVRLWPVGDSTSQTVLKGHTQPVTSVAFAPDGKTLVSASADRTLRLWQVSDGTSLRVFQGHTAEVTSVAFSPDGKTIVSAGADGSARLWRVADGTLVYLLKEAAQTVLFSPDGQILMIGGSGNLKLHRTTDGFRLQSLRETVVDQEQAAFSPDSQTVASGSGDDVVRLWHAKDGNIVRTLKGTPPSSKPSQLVNTAAFSPDGQLIVSGTSAGQVLVWKTGDGTLVTSVANGTAQVMELAFAADGRVLYVLTHDGSLWQLGVK